MSKINLSVVVLPLPGPPVMMDMGYDNTRTRTDQIIDAAADVQRKTPLELFEELYESLPESHDT